MPQGGATSKIFLHFRPLSPIIFIGNSSLWRMMMKTSSARNIPGVWCKLMARRILALGGILLAADPALLAQGAAERLARGIERFESGRYSEAVQELKAVQLPTVSDYTAYYLAASKAELKDFTEVQKDLAPFRNLSAPSPLSAKAALIEAKALAEAGSAAAGIALLRERYDEIPQPAGDLTLAQCYEAAHDPAQAATYYQRVYFLYPLSDAAGKAAKAIEALRVSMGAAYPPPMPQQMLERGSGLRAAREYTRACSEFPALVQQLGGSERAMASVRLGAVDYAERKTERASG